MTRRARAARGDARLLVGRSHPRTRVRTAAGRRHRRRSTAPREIPSLPDRLSVHGRSAARAAGLRSPPRCWGRAWRRSCWPASPAGAAAPFAAAADPRAVPHRPRRAARRRQLRHRPVGHDGDGASTRPSTARATARRPRRSTATRTSITVGAVSEYQWTASVDLPAAGPYCYRAVPRRGRPARHGRPRRVFTTQVAAGASDPVHLRRARRLGPGRRHRRQNPTRPNLIARRSRPAAPGSPSPSATTATRTAARSTTATCSRRARAPARSSGRPSGRSPGSTIAALHRPRATTACSGTTHTDITTWTQDAGGVDVRRALPERRLLLRQRHHLGELRQRVVRVRRRATCPLLHARLGLGRHEQGHRPRRTRTTPRPTSRRARPSTSGCVNDLQSHPSQLKFAFSHYPFYADNNDRALGHLPRRHRQPRRPARAQRRADGLQRPRAHLRAQHPGSAGHAGHLRHRGRRRNARADRPVQRPSTPTASAGRRPSSRATRAARPRRPRPPRRVYHFLKVTVAGTTVTVAPTDSSWQRPSTSQTYTFTGPPETYLDSTPPALTSSTTSATFTFHSSDHGRDVHLLARRRGRDVPARSPADGTADWPTARTR